MGTNNPHETEVRLGVLGVGAHNAALLNCMTKLGTCASQTAVGDASGSMHQEHTGDSKRWVAEVHGSEHAGASEDAHLVRNVM
jgi:malic enzyme